ncbi:MAG: FkbM family methyltransferase, partial [Pseudomonadales bacterium]|nr:FkbM family methyltransferase [Pseudomonadales bacterium]
MEFKTTFTQMTQHIVESGVLRSNPFILLDVGCSGGIASLWRLFGTSLRAIGVDPVKSEINRLNNTESFEGVNYRSAYIGLPDSHPIVVAREGGEPWGGNPWNRLSAHVAAEIIRQKNEVENKLTTLNDWQNSDLVNQEQKLTVDELVNRENLEDLDFIKIDIDGYDLDVIYSAMNVMNAAPVLGFTLEVNYFGSTSNSDHTFHNTDRLMRESGFDLFDLSVRRYSSSALPAPFTHRCPAQTHYGRPLQGDALYLRDPMSKGTRKAPICPDLDALKTLKLACLFELFGLPDHAAELIIGQRDKITTLCPTGDLL